jgi:carbon monoxide dehydrogenase subunit G
MFRFTSNILVNRSLEDVWSVLIDFPNVPSWEEGVIAVRQVSSGAPGVGTTLVVRRVYVGRETRVECRITDWEELRGATMSLHGGPLQHASVRYAVEPAGSDQTVVTYTAEGELHPALKILTPLMPALGRAGANKNLANLKRLLEAPGQDASPS